ncbi:conserved exported hypothetical protein [Candidatus Nitrotoga sp. BS]|uniref:CDP-glycerol glycerophosphotransferase family protein n=1 Tax=Candidatus Nitrotoga sp. BS TaxID=2890408 RepID=UPI001EF38CF1|nr:CDP-glycerol glycerophosphotransferase family protein [Candidatus Nitrotoga sp. BS]CAH1202368.1 conserved exported hypothetical protein [Candidatus Nitrotoga sp. BS]
MKNTKPVMLVVLLAAMVPENAYAYIDPASGNAIASFFIALFGSAIFFLKTLFYKIFSRSSSETKLGNGNKGEQPMAVLFSEGKTYWTTFRPIVEELINQKIHFRYITLDVHDPGLEIDSVFMHSKRVQKSRLGFAKIANIESPVMLSTTPNIGSVGYPMNRPARVKNLVHVFHAMVDLSCYRKGSLDFYDTVLMTGAHEEHYIRLVEKARKLKNKSLIVVGLPCLDDLNRQKKEAELSIDSKKLTEKTVLVAPSWGAKGCFSEYGTDFVKTLAAANYRVIIRLHPHSYIFEPDSVESWFAQTKDLKNVIWDSNPFGTHVMSQADILISDASSIRFDFAFLYQRPVITLPISQQSRSIFESDYMPETWADTMSEKIGVTVNSDRLHIIDQVVEETISHFTSEKLEELRDTSVANFGNSAFAIVAHLNQQVELLSMTAGERSLKQQVDTLKNEMADLRKRLNQPEIAEFKDFSE